MLFLSRTLENRLKYLFIMQQNDFFIQMVGGVFKVSGNIFKQGCLRSDLFIETDTYDCNSNGMLLQLYERHKSGLWVTIFTILVPFALMLRPKVKLFLKCSGKLLRFELWIRYEIINRRHNVLMEHITELCYPHGMLIISSVVFYHRIAKLFT